MKKFFLLMATVFGMSFANEANAEVYKDWNGIDVVTVTQDVDVQEAKTIYLVNDNNLTYKKGKQDPKQDAVVAQFPGKVKAAIEAEFTNAKVEIVDSEASVPADGLLVKFGMTSIDWGNAAVRQLTVPGLGGMHCTLEVAVTNPKGQVCKAVHERYQSTVISSAKGPNVVKRFSEAFTDDILTILKNL